MDTKDLIIDAIYGIDEEDDIEGSYTCGYGEYLVRIEWDDTDACVAEVKKNGLPCKLPPNINEELLIDVVKEKIREISQKKNEEDRANEEARMQREHEKTINWSGTMAGY